MMIWLVASLSGTLACISLSWCSSDYARSCLSTSSCFHFFVAEICKGEVQQFWREKVSFSSPQPSSPPKVVVALTSLKFCTRQSYYSYVGFLDTCPLDRRWCGATLTPFQLGALILKNLLWSSRLRPLPFVLWYPPLLLCAAVIVANNGCCYSNIWIFWRQRIKQKNNYAAVNNNCAHI